MKDDSLINTLPDDCLMHIFSFLSFDDKLNAEKVCKRWCKIGERGWVSSKAIDLREWIPRNKLHCIFKRCGRFLKKIQIFMGREYHNCIPLIMEFCRLDQLEEILIEHTDSILDSDDFDDDKINEDLTALFEKTTNLIAVTIGGDVIMNKMDYLNILPSKTLQALEIRNTNSLASAHLSLDINRYPNLIQLMCENITVDGVDDEVSDSMELTNLLLFAKVSEKFIKKIPSFTNLSGLILGEKCEIDNEDICNIARNCPYLKEFQCAQHMTTTALQLLGKMSFLKVLILSNISDYDDIRYLKNVKTLALTNSRILNDYNGLLQLIASSSSLEYVLIWRVKISSKTFMEELGNIFKNGQRKKPLKIAFNRPIGVSFDHECEESPHPLLDLEIIYK